MMKKIFFLFFLLILLQCKEKQPKTQLMDPNAIEQSPILHDSLTTEQLKKIDYLYETFKEVDSTTKETWITDFRRDANPDDEMTIWMQIAMAYNAFLKEKPEVSLDQKKEVFTVLLLRSSIHESEVLKQMKLKYITKEEALSVMKNYTLKAQPITVY